MLSASQVNKVLCEKVYRRTLSLRRPFEKVPLEAPAIIKAAATNSIGLVEEWIENGGDINACDGSGYTALHYATARDHADVVRTLLQRKVDVVVRAELETLTDVAIAHDSSLALDAILDLQPHAMLCRDENLLHDTVIYGALKCTQIVIKHNADVNNQDNAGSFALREACAGLVVEMQELMKNKDTMLAIIRTLVASHGIKLDQRGPFQETALHCAAYADSMEAVTCLVEAGANPSLQDRKGDTPAEFVRTNRTVREYLLSCQGPVSFVGMKGADYGNDDDDNVIVPDVQTAACLVHPGKGASLSVKKGNVSSGTVPDLQEKSLCASSSPSSLFHAPSLEFDQPSAQLTLKPGAVDQKTFFTLHQLPSPPAIAVSKQTFGHASKKPASKRKIKAARKKEKKLKKDTAAAMKSLFPVGDSRDTLTLSESQKMFVCPHPSASPDTSNVVSPIVAVSTNKPVTLLQPGKLIIPHAARPSVSVQTDPHSCSYELTVQEASLQDDGLGLTDWKAVDDKDVHVTGNFATVLMRNVSMFSAFVVTAVKKTYKAITKKWMLKEIEFCVVGSTFYDKVMIPRVAWFTNGWTPKTACHELGSRGTVERAVVWGSSHAVQIAPDEDLRIQICMDQDDWSVEPEEQEIQKNCLFSAQAVSSVGFKLTAPSPKPCQAAGLCSVHVPGEKTLKIPFLPPRIVHYRNQDSSPSCFDKAANRMAIVEAQLATLAIAEAQSSSCQDFVSPVVDTAAACEPSTELNHEGFEPIISGQAKATSAKAPHSTTVQPESQPARSVLVRKYWSMLKQRLCPEEIMDRLYEEDIISDRILQQIQSAKTQLKRVDILMNKVKTLSDENIRKFAEVLSESHGIDDVGKKMLCDIDNAAGSL